MSATGISVVTTTWNERGNIKNLILSVRTVLKGVPHEIIVVDNDSPDGTIQVAKRLADVAVTRKREGQTKGLLYGMRLAKYSVIVTIDADLENDPELIPLMIKQTSKCHMVMASRTKLPRISEKIASKTLGKLVGVTDTLSNFKAFKKETVSKFNLRGERHSAPNFWLSPRKKD